MGTIDEIATTRLRRPLLSGSGVGVSVDNLSWVCAAFRLFDARADTFRSLSGLTSALAFSSSSSASLPSL